MPRMVPPAVQWGMAATKADLELFSDTAERSLDPSDWRRLRDLGHRMLDEMFEYLETVQERPVWQPVPAEVKARLHAPLPWQPQGAEAVYEDFRRDVLPYPVGNIHPRFWGWVTSSGTVFGALAEFLGGAINSPTFGAEQAGIHVENQVVDWFKELVGYPREASGLLVTGGSTANLVGLAVARYAAAGADINRGGVEAVPERLAFYASNEVHNSVGKALVLMGLGLDSLRPVPVDDAYRIDLRALQEMIASDRARGLRPACVIGTSGTVNTGAVDDLHALADTAARERLWFHVDGAIGVPAVISERLRPLLKGLERADSIGFDLHKWMYVQYGCACVLVRDEQKHRGTFKLSADYLKPAARGLASSKTWFSEYGPELSREFRALKVWMSLKETGLEAFARQIEQNVAQARYLAGLVEQSPDLELMAPVELNIVCYRFVAPRLTPEALDVLNQEILYELQEQGIAAPSSTWLRGRFAIRVANVNHRSRRADFDVLARETVRLGHRLLAAGATK